MAGPNTTAYAIVGAGALVGLGLFFGLRSNRPADVAPPTSTAGSAKAGAPSGGPSSTDPAGTSAGQPPAAVAAATLPDRKGVEAEVGRALDAQRPLLRERCWVPMAKKNPTPAEASYLFDVGIDPSGKEVARGINTPAGSRDDVGNCLRMLIAPITIAPPGKPVTVRVTVKLP